MNQYRILYSEADQPRQWEGEADCQKSFLADCIRQGIGSLSWRELHQTIGQKWLIVQRFS